MLSFEKFSNGNNIDRRVQRTWLKVRLSREYSTLKLFSSHLMACLSTITRFVREIILPHLLLFARSHKIRRVETKRGKFLVLIRQKTDVAFISEMRRKGENQLGSCCDSTNKKNDENFCEKHVSIRRRRRWSNAIKIDLSNG